MSSVRFLPYPRFQALDDNGNPLSGGKVFVYSAGTTNKIDSWTDFDKTSKNTNPVILDSRGEADIFFDKAAKIVLKDSSDVTVWTLDDVEPLTSQTITGKYNLVENGSFELDGDGDSIPDGWSTTSNTSTATLEIDTTTVSHGTSSFKFASAGAGGGKLTSERFSVPDGSNVGVSFYVSTNNTTATNKLDLIFYDKDGNGTSTTNVWSGGGTQPSSLTQKVFGVSVPSGKTQAECRLTGVDNAETATTYFDHVQVLDQNYVFTGTGGEVTASAAELNIMDGVTSNTTELSTLSGHETQLNILLNSYDNDTNIGLGGDFQFSPNLTAYNVGDVVTLTFYGSMSLTSTTATATGSGLPSQFRPISSSVQMVGYADASLIVIVEVQTGGAVTLHFRDWAGADNAQSTTPSYAFGITYNRAV